MRSFTFVVLLVLSMDGFSQFNILPASNAPAQRPRRAAPRPRNDRRAAPATPMAPAKPQIPTGPLSDYMKCANFIGSQMNSSGYHIESPTHHYFFQQQGQGCVRENDQERSVNTAGFLQITASGTRFCPLPEGAAGLVPGRPNRFSVGGSTVTYPRQTGGQVVHILSNFREEKCCREQTQGAWNDRILNQKKNGIESFAKAKHSTRSPKEISTDLSPHCGADTEKIVNAALGVDGRTTEASAPTVEQ